MNGYYRLRGLGQDSYDPYLDSAAGAGVLSVDWWTENLEKILAAKQVYDINQLNLERLRRGQPPLPASYAAAAAPRLSVGLAPEMQTMVWIGLAVLAVLFVLPRIVR